MVKIIQKTVIETILDRVNVVSQASLLSFGTAHWVVLNAKNRSAVLVRITLLAFLVDGIFQSPLHVLR